MKKTLLFTGIILSIHFLKAQPEINSWIMTTGFAEYSFGGPRTITMADLGDVQQVCYNATDVYVEATGLAGTYVMGPWVGNPNLPGAQNYVFKLPRNPTEELGTKTEVPLLGSVGVAVNGVVFYGYGDGRSYSAATGNNEPNGDGNWNSDAWISEGSTMDASGNGHSDQNMNYHYHANPIALYSTAGTTHSPIIGFAYDGFPIYGPFGYTSPMDAQSGISRMRSGYELRNITDRTTLPGGGASVPPGPTLAAQTLGTYIEDYEHTQNGDLDEYGGRFCFTPEYPTGTYAYFISTDTNGDPQFPYLFASHYYGEVTTTSTNNTKPGGLTCGTPTSLLEINATIESVDIFPNPANEKINFTFNQNRPNEIVVINALGKQVMTTNAENAISINHLPKGMYTIKLFFENAITTKRLVKE